MEIEKTPYSSLKSLVKALKRRHPEAKIEKTGNDFVHFSVNDAEYPTILAERNKGKWSIPFRIPF